MGSLGFARPPSLRISFSKASYFEQTLNLTVIQTSPSSGRSKCSQSLVKQPEAGRFISQSSMYSSKRFLILLLIAGCDQGHPTDYKQTQQPRSLARPDPLPKIQSVPTDFYIHISRASLTRRSSQSLQVDVNFQIEKGKPVLGRKYRFLLEFPGTSHSAWFDIDSAEMQTTELTFLIDDPSKSSSLKLSPPADFSLSIMASDQR